MCLIPVSASVAVGREREQARGRARVEADVPVELVFPGGNRVQANSSDLSLSGARLTLDRPLNVADGDQVDSVLRARAARWSRSRQPWSAGRMNRLSCGSTRARLAVESAVARVFFGRPNAWLHWDHWPKDRPLHSLFNLVRATVGAVFRKYRFKCLQSAGGPPSGRRSRSSPRLRRGPASLCEHRRRPSVPAKSRRSSPSPCWSRRPWPRPPCRSSRQRQRRCPRSRCPGRPLPRPLRRLRLLGRSRAGAR